MDDSFTNRPLADDPDFLARLSILDDGLDSGLSEGEAQRPPPRPRPPDPALPPVRPARALTPVAQAPVLWPTPTSTSGPRPLLDLFPPGLGGGPAPPSLAATAPPRIARPSAPRSPAAALTDTLTYETFYGLNEKPFSPSSDLRFLYHSASHDRVAEELVSAIQRRECLIVLTGEAGTGKSTLCRAAIERLDRRTLTSLVLDPFVTVEDLLKTALVDFGVISRDDLALGRLTRASRNDLSAALRDFLRSLVALQASAVIMIDEAQDLPIEVLEQVGELTDLDDRQRLLQLVLVGQPRLLTLLARPELRRVDRQVSVRCELEPLAQEEISEYIEHRLAVAGSRARVRFDDGAIARVYELSGGVPRIVDLVCDRALTLGHRASASAIDLDVITQAADDLDLRPPRSPVSWMARAVMGVLALALLTLVGATAAAVVFRARLTRAAVVWEQVPPPPDAPVLRVTEPLAPLGPPPGTAEAPSL